MNVWLSRFRKKISLIVLKYQISPNEISAMLTPNSVWLKHWGWKKIAAISQTTSSNAFFFIKIVWISPQISLKCIPTVRINIIPALGQIIVWRRPGAKPLSEPFDGYSTVAYMRLSASMSFNWAGSYLLVDGCDNSALNIRLVSLTAVLSRSKRNCYSPRCFPHRLLSSVDY